MITTFDPAELPPPDPAGAVVSVGVFDGVHLGHQAILAGNVARAQALGAVPVVVTFRDHPKGVLLGRAPKTLTTLDHRLELFRRAGIGHALALRFDEALRRMSAEDFIRDLLVAKLGARSFVLGFDSKFGKDRAGSPALLSELGFDVEVVAKVVIDQRAVSSTAIREAVDLGDLAAAERMLGRPVSVFGEVVHGAAVGRSIGFPTANLDLHHELHPPNGVYACRAHLFAPDGGGLREAWPAVANIGFRPTVEGQASDQPVVEVHLLDFDGDLYGRPLELEFVGRIRAEHRFDGVEALRAQIAKDVAEARRIVAAV